MEDNKSFEIKKEDEITVTLTAEQWSTLLFTLDEQPRKIAQPIWTVINNAIVARAKELMSTNGVAVVDAEDGMDEEKADIEIEK